MCNHDELREDNERLRTEFKIMSGEFKELQRSAHKAIMLNVEEMQEIRKAVTQYKEYNEEIIAAWETAGGLINFVKALGKFAAAITAIGVAVYGATHWRP